MQRTVYLVVEEGERLQIMANVRKYNTLLFFYFLLTLAFHFCSVLSWCTAKISFVLSSFPLRSPNSPQFWYINLSLYAHFYYLLIFFFRVVFHSRCFHISMVSVCVRVCFKSISYAYTHQMEQKRPIKRYTKVFCMCLTI